MISEISRYGIYEEVNGDIYTEQIDADNDEDAITEADEIHQDDF